MECGNEPKKIVETFRKFQPSIVATALRKLPNGEELMDNQNQNQGNRTRISDVSDQDFGKVQEAAAGFEPAVVATVLRSLPGGSEVMDNQNQNQNQGGKMPSGDISSEVRMITEFAKDFEPEVLSVGIRNVAGLSELMDNQNQNQGAKRAIPKCPDNVGSLKEKIDSFQPKVVASFLRQMSGGAELMDNQNQNQGSQLR